MLVLVAPDNHEIQPHALRLPLLKPIINPRGLKPPPKPKPPEPRKMPSHANITITLHTQYDAAPIRERNIRLPPSPSQHTSDDDSDSDGGRGNRKGIVETDITALPSSQFWIKYICNPYPCSLSLRCSEESGQHDDADADDDDHRNHESADEEAVKSQDANSKSVKYFYFKLLLTGICVLSWGVGAEEGWRGRTVCGFMDGGTDFEGRRVVEKRGFFFGGERAGRSGMGKGGAEGGFEIQVFRAKARRRQQVRYERVEGGGEGVV